jgi:hypothetical protein
MAGGTELINLDGDALRSTAAPMFMTGFGKIDPKYFNFNPLGCLCL